MITLTATEILLLQLPMEWWTILLDVTELLVLVQLQYLFSFDGGTTYSILTTDIGTDLAITDDYNAIVTVPGRHRC